MRMGSFRGQRTVRNRAKHQKNKKYEELGTVELHRCKYETYTKQTEVKHGKQIAFDGVVRMNNAPHKQSKMKLYWNPAWKCRGAPVLTGRCITPNNQKLTVELWYSQYGGYWGKLGNALRLRLKERGNVVTGAVLKHS